VYLHSGAVQLRLENALAAELFQRLAHACGGLRQHRADRTAHLQGERVQCHRSAGQACRGDRSKVAAQHRRAPYRGGGNLRRGGDGIGHHAGQRALAQLAGQQPTQERLLDFGCRREQSADQLGAPRLRALAGYGADRREGGVDIGHGQAWLSRGRRQRPQSRPADTDLALRQLSGKPGHDDRDQLGIGFGLAQQLGDPCDLGQPRRRAANVSRGRRHIDQQHSPPLHA
jgi:hypothetical protein